MTSSVLGLLGLFNFWVEMITQISYTVLDNFTMSSVCLQHVNKITFILYFYKEVWNV